MPRHQPAAPTPHPTGPRITQRQIEVFRAVMSSGGVTAAAHALNSSQPTVSRELARMAQLLGYALFTRQRGRLAETSIYAIKTELLPFSISYSVF